MELRVDGKVEGIYWREVQLVVQVHTVAVVKLDERLPRPMPHHADVPVDVVQLHTGGKRTAD